LTTHHDRLEAEDSLAPASAPPFVVGRPTTSSWREHVLTRAAEHRFVVVWLADRIAARDQPALAAIETHLKVAQEAADGTDPKGWKRIWGGVTGATVERARSHLDAAESELLHLAPRSYLLGQMPSLVAHVRAHLDKDDPRRVGVEQIYKRVSDQVARRSLANGAGEPRAPLHDDLDDWDYDTIIAAVRHASAQARRDVTRVRSFRNLLLVCALFLTVGVGVVIVVGAADPTVMPLCFNPEGMVVCPTQSEAAPGQAGAGNGTAEPESLTPAQKERVDDEMRETANCWDIPLFALLGFIAAAVAAATALRRIKGTSTEFSLPVALAVLKLPTGALTALLGLLLMRGDFVPGLSALDSSAQIIAWAIIFGYAQELLTRFVDNRAQGVLADVAPGDPAPSREPAAPSAPA
jgi:hypothetical protein